MKEVKKKIHIYQTEHFFLNLFTGSISKYIDVILNFGATKVTGDSLMHQLNRNHVRTVFYGDDTWLKLFSPESFFRYEGVSSFYVSDFTEVDNNVTRNLQLELQSPQDWDVMILHYLGLDRSYWAYREFIQSYDSYQATGNGRNHSANSQRVNSKSNSKW